MTFIMTFIFFSFKFLFKFYLKLNLLLLIFNLILICFNSDFQIFDLKIEDYMFNMLDNAGQNASTSQDNNVSDIVYWQEQAKFCKEISEDPTYTEEERKQAKEEYGYCMKNISSSIAEKKAAENTENFSSTSNSSDLKRKADININYDNKRK